MVDIWSGIGQNLSQDGGVWLYRVNGEVRGPLPLQALVDKLALGQIDSRTPVAREGTDFHPLGAVAAFAPHLEGARRSATGRLHKQVRRRRLQAAAVILVLLGGGALLARQTYRQRQEQTKLQANQQLRAQIEQLRAQAASRVAQATAVQRAHPMALVALVSLGDASDIRIHRGKKGHAAKLHGRGGLRSPNRAPAPGGGPGASGAPSTDAAEEEESVQTCGLSQSAIFGTLRASLGKINVCVEDEKTRDKDNLLPPRLSLQFVVRPSGKVVDFVVDDRHFRTGPLNNCLTKAFNTLSFPSSTGANCPVTIPIKIGK
jgi:type II secretory pathway pseudopilin PulG